MTPDFLLALAGFAFVTSVTPGPNNLMLMASGVHFGLRRSMPHMFGISLGLAAMIVVVGLGAARAMHALPLLDLGLRAGCLAFILWMSWSLLVADAPDGAGAKATPMTFLQAAGFQWINPKAWAMALTAIAAFAPESNLGAVATVALVFAIVSLPSILVWAAAGKRLRVFLIDTSRRRVFNIGMAILLVASVLPMIVPMG